LGEPIWASLAPVPAIERVVGVDLDARIAWAVGPAGALAAVDLESRAVRKQLTGVSTAVVGPDGSLYVADADRRVRRVLHRSPLEFHDPLPATPVMLFGAVNDLLIAVTGDKPARLITTSADQAVHTTILPAGEVGATFWGDLVAVAADTAVVLYETIGGRRAVTPLHTRHRAHRVAFSPSGHRIYVGGDASELEVYDRFSLSEIAHIKLPAPARALRVDASGRWMLVRPPSADSVWVVDLATNRLAGPVAGTWGPDLPLVAGAATLVTRLGADLASFDLRQAPPRLIARLEGGGEDLWLAAAWLPRERLRAAAAAAESATVVQDTALAADSLKVDADSAGIFLQVSTSQNPDWAGQLARQLKDAGFPSRVLQPKGPDDGYRVVVGPYATRDIAEENGRKLGRPFFILRESQRHP